MFSEKPLLALCALACVYLPFVPSQSRAADLDAEAWPEIDIWIALDDVQKNRLYILLSFTEEPDYQYEETAIGISWDQRFHPHWSWRAGIRYIDKQVEPPDQGETRAVFDLKWYQELGRDWMLTNRNRMDLRRFDGDADSSFRYRNRTQLEKPYGSLFSSPITWFGSYEIYYDSRYDEWGQRQRVIGGGSVRFNEWSSVDVFMGYHVESEPKRETGEALGIAFGLYF